MPFSFYWKAAIIPLFFLSCQPPSVKHARPGVEPITWAKRLDSCPWPEGSAIQMMTIGDTLWVFHATGNWYSTDAKTWTRSDLPNVIGSPEFLDYVFFKNKLFGLGHFEGNTEEPTIRATIYFSSDRVHWDSIVNTNLQKRYHYHPFVFQDKIWIIGGEQDSNIWSDIINSPDGIHWQIMKDKLPFGPVINSRILVYNDQIWMFNEDVWSSVDGYQWTQVTKAILAGEKLMDYAAVVYHNKMWLIGCRGLGQANPQALFSEDGKHWAIATTPWPPRSGAATTVWRDKIIMVGGKNGGTVNHPEFRHLNDEWEMSDTTHSFPTYQGKTGSEKEEQEQLIFGVF